MPSTRGYEIRLRLGQRDELPTLALHAPARRVELLQHDVHLQRRAPVSPPRRLSLVYFVEAPLDKGVLCTRALSSNECVLCKGHPKVRHSASKLNQPCKHDNR